MKKYLFIMKTTLNDSIQYISSLFIRFIGFAITMTVLLSLWTFIYSSGDGIIKGYTLNQMYWYLLLAEIIAFGSGSLVATNEIRDCIKSGNIAYQINKPYHYIIYSICKYFADTMIRLIAFSLVATFLGIIFVGKIEGVTWISFLACIPVFLLAVLITGMIRILINGYIALIIFNFSIKNILLYTLLILLGALIYTSFVVICNSLTFYFIKFGETAEILKDIFINGILYPDIIFKRGIKIIFFTIIPCAISSWIPVHLLMHFELAKGAILICFTIGIIIVAFLFFSHSLKKYSSTNLMGTRS